MKSIDRREWRENLRRRLCPHYVGHETVIRRDDGTGLPAWEERLFAMMDRNALHVTDFFRLPDAQVVETGRHVAI